MRKRCFAEASYGNRGLMEATRVSRLAASSTATSSPLGDLLLEKLGRRHLVDWVASPHVGDTLGTGREHFAFFAERLDQTRQRIRYLLADAERTLAHDTGHNVQHRAFLLAAIQHAETDLRMARNSRLGWQDVHAGDADIMTRCESLRQLLAASVERHGCQLRGAS